MRASTHTHKHIVQQSLSQGSECIHFAHIDNCGQHSEQKYKNENISRPNSFKGKAKKPKKHENIFELFVLHTAHTQTHKFLKTTQEKIKCRFGGWFQESSWVQTWTEKKKKENYVVLMLHPAKDP